MSDSSRRRAATRATRARQHETGEPYAEARRHTTAEDDHDPAPDQRQHTAHSSMLGNHFTLVPPLAEEFSVSGTRDVVNRARQWALHHRLLLFKGNADRCVHGLYRMDSCAARKACGAAGLDHTQIWVRHDARGAFLLTQPYVDKIPEALAVGLEAQLHAALTEQRVNKVNLRREFFYANPARVRDLLQQIAGQHLLAYHDTPEALEWRASGAHEQDTQPTSQHMPVPV